MEEAKGKRRVKLYQLDDEGHWADKGTGHCFCIFSESLGAMCFRVRSEVDDGVLLESKVVKDDVYQLQQTTLIVWTEPSGRDMALSFQHAEGCQEVWQQICEIQSSLEDEDGHQQAHSDEDDEEEEEEDGEELSSDDNSEHDGHSPSLYLPEGVRLRSRVNSIDAAMSRLSQQTSQSDMMEDDIASFELPPAELGHLPDLATLLSSPLSMARKDHTVSFLGSHKDYLVQLLDLFGVAEDLQDLDSLHHLYTIFKHIVLLNDATLFQVLLSDELIHKLFGVFEYEPDASTVHRHRDYLAHQATYKEVIAIHDPDIKTKIHQTFRIHYLKDVILPRALDDATFNSLNSMIFFNQLDIVHYLQCNDVFLTELFQNTLKSPDLPEHRFREAILFIEEFCTISRNLQGNDRTFFYASLCEHGLFDILPKSLLHTDVQIRTATADILASLQEHDIQLLRRFLMRRETAPSDAVSTPCLPESSSPSLLTPTPTAVDSPPQDPRVLYPLYSAIITCILSDADHGMKAMMTDLVKNILDVDEQHDVLLVFYGTYMGWMRGVLARLPHSVWQPRLASQRKGTEALQRYVLRKEDKYDASADAETIYCLLDLMTYCLSRHAHPMRRELLDKALLTELSTLFFCQQKYLVLALMRLLKMLLMVTQQQPQAAAVLSTTLLDAVMMVFVENGDANNLLNSSLLDFFETLIKCDRVAWITYLIETYGDTLRQIQYVQTFREMQQLYDKHQLQRDYFEEEEEEESEESEQEEKEQENTEGSTHKTLGRHGNPQDEDMPAHLIMRKRKSSDDDEEDERKDNNTNSCNEGTSAVVEGAMKKSLEGLRIKPMVIKLKRVYDESDEEKSTPEEEDSKETELTVDEKGEPRTPSPAKKRAKSLSSPRSSPVDPAAAAVPQTGSPHRRVQSVDRQRSLRDSVQEISEVGVSPKSSVYVSVGTAAAVAAGGAATGSSPLRHLGLSTAGLVAPKGAAAMAASVVAALKQRSDGGMGETESGVAVEEEAQWSDSPLGSGGGSTGNVVVKMP